MKIDKMICMASHEFQWQLYPFAAMLRKYWGRDLDIIYYCDYVEDDLPDGVEARQVPLMAERDERHWSWQHDFGDGFASILRSLPDTVLAVSMLDCWLAGPADLDMIDSLASYLEAHPKVVRAQLGAIKGIDKVGHLVEVWDSMQIMTCPAKDNFNGGVMFNVGLFNRETALQVVKNTCVLDSEIMGWKEMQKRTDLMSVWVRDAEGMYDYTHATVRTERHRAFIRDVPLAEDRELIKSLLPDNIRPWE